MGGLATALELDPESGIDLARDPPTYAAYLELSEAYERFRHGDFRGSIPHAERAVALDSSLLFLGLSNAAIAYRNSGGFSQADSLVRVLSRVRDLAPWERDFLEYVRSYVHGDLTAILRVNRKLAVRFPQSMAPYTAGWAALRVNRPREAVEWLRPLDPERGSMRGWWPYWSFLTQTYHVLGQHRRELRAALRGRRQYPDNLALLRRELEARAARGQHERVVALLEESLTLRRPGDPYLTLAMVASLDFRAHGHPDHALDVVERAVARYRSLPDEEARAALGSPIRLVQLLLYGGRWAEAEEALEALAADNPDNLEIKGSLGVLAAWQEDRDKASEADRWLAALDRPYLYGWHTEWRTRIAAALGQQDEAVRLLQEAFNQGVPFNPWVHRDPTFAALHDYPPFQELLRPKG
jgi:tetratricopeptide (TPR) repeat protein